MPLRRFGDFAISAHARSEMERRGITEDIVRRVVSSPEQELPIRGGRVVLQSRIHMGSPPKSYVVRVFVDTNNRPARIVTVYRTTKVDKYWRRS
jgi:hypothetical protein